MTVRARIAPSPTGPLHIGTARTALFNYLFVQNQKGKLILRIDDTDTERSQKHFEHDIKEGLSWLGILWEEEARQSERLDIYARYLERLLAEKKIFWCPHTKDELEKERGEHMRLKQPPRHICEFRGGERNNEEKSILRFKNDAATPVIFRDAIRGEISFNPTMLGDFSVAKNISEPLYNFTTVIDDALMEITHIIRGEDHIPNTPKQILLQRALGFAEPLYAHLPLILGRDKSKLSKRDGATGIAEYKNEGYLAPAFLNFLALLGWHPQEKKEAKKGEKEIFSKEDLAGLFSLSDIQKGGAVFDIEKLRWINGMYIRNVSAEELSRMLLPYIKPDWQATVANADPLWWRRITALEQPRLVTLSDIAERVDYFFETPTLQKKILLHDSLSEKDTKKHLEIIHAILQNMPKEPFASDALHKEIMPYAEAHGKKEVLWPLRVALTGKKASSGLFEVAELLGKEIVEKRIAQAIKLLDEEKG